MTEHYVSDTELTIPDRKPADRSVPRAIPTPRIVRKQHSSGRNGKCLVIVVSLEVMEKLWVS